MRVRRWLNTPLLSVDRSDTRARSLWTACPPEVSSRTLCGAHGSVRSRTRVLPAHRAHGGLRWSRRYVREERSTTPKGLARAWRGVRRPSLWDCIPLQTLPSMLGALYMACIVLGAPLAMPLLRPSCILHRCCSTLLCTMKACCRPSSPNYPPSASAVISNLVSNLCPGASDHGSSRGRLG